MKLLDSVLNLAGKLYGRINWRIPKGKDNDFLERTTIQTFNQQDNPAILKNYDNKCALLSLYAGEPEALLERRGFARLCGGAVLLE